MSKFQQKAEAQTKQIIGQMLGDELLVQEGQVFNSRLWDISVLRLNQLNYFDALKPEDDTERKLDPQNGTVDLTVKVKEKNSDAAEATATKGLNTAQQTHLQGPAAAAGAGVNEGSVTEDQASRVVERTLTLQNA